MSDSRSHTHEIALPVPAERVFEILHTPSDIRGWWNASRAVVIPEQGGFWAAAWGDDEDAPDYVGSATIAVFDPPRRMKLVDYVFRSRVAGELDPPSDTSRMTTNFTVTGTADGCILRVTQDGFPPAGECDGYYEACKLGWKNTFDGVERHLTTTA